MILEQLTASHDIHLSEEPEQVLADYITEYKKTVMVEAVRSPEQARHAAAEHNQHIFNHLKNRGSHGRQ